MITAILTVVAGLLAALPQILMWIERRYVTERKMADALVQRDISELSDGLDRVRKP